MVRYNTAGCPANALTVGIFCSPQVSLCWPRHSVSCFIWDHTDSQISLMLLYSLTWPRCWKMIYPPFMSPVKWTLNSCFVAPCPFAFLGWVLTQFTDTDSHTCTEPCPHIWNHLWNLMLLLFDGHNAHDQLGPYEVQVLLFLLSNSQPYTVTFLLCFLLHTVHIVSV